MHRESSNPPKSQAAERLAAEFTEICARPLPPGLYLVATPIGNLADITLRALAVLARASCIWCEDTRRSRTLLAHYGLSAPLHPYHEHNAAAERPRVLAALAEGGSVALISDAGTPLISDPGYKLVREALAAGHRVESIPGPSAVLTALTASGLPTHSFCFAGFLPARAAARRAEISRLADIPATLVFFEAPSRTAETLADLATALGPREAALTRELTKLHEEVLRDTLPGLARRAAETPPRGEVTLVVAPPTQLEASDVDITARLLELLPHTSLRDAARIVSEELGAAKGRVYALGLTLERARRS